jgi:hypothetical protein
MRTNARSDSRTLNELGRAAASGVGTNPLGAIVLLGVPALLAAATMAACWIPARRAAKVDPTRALRQE